MLAAFIPDNLEVWTQEDGTKVTFYPFLVVLKRHGRDNAIWLPYWHIIEGKRRKQKYGQWAPCMDAAHFDSLLKQAKAAGFWRESRSP